MARLELAEPVAAVAIPSCLTCALTSQSLWSSGAFRGDRRATWEEQLRLKPTTQQLKLKAVLTLLGGMLNPRT